MSEAADRVPDVDDCRNARALVSGDVTRTAVRRFDWLSRIVGRETWAKLELQQVTGSFKFRGALNVLRHLSSDIPVVTASAGNHALALAQASHLTGHHVTVFLPHTASESKRERLVQSGVSLVDWGETLEEAEHRARAVCARSGAAWVSPYSNRWVIAGQAGVVYEFLEQVPQLETIVVPIGGGGLVTAALLAASEARPGLHVVGCQPQRYCAFQMACEGHSKNLPFRSTLADGLMVQVDAASPTVAACTGRLERMCTLNEQHVAAAIHSLLHHESLLVEGAGAVGVAAALAGDLAELPGTGAVGILLTGGNITSGALSTVLTYPFASDVLRRHLGLQGRLAGEVPYAPGAGCALAAPEKEGRTESTAFCASDRLEGLRQHVADTHVARRQLLAFCAAEGLELAPEEKAALDSVERVLQGLVDAYDRCAANTDTNDMIRRERLERLAYQMSAFLQTASSWQSPTSAQSIVTGFTRTSSQCSDSTNYSRYHSNTVVEMEHRLLEALGLDGTRASLLLFSSGMAAYQAVESHLVRGVLRPGSRVLLPPYIYFESEEQLAGLPGIEIVRLSDTRTKTVVDAVKTYRPQVLFLDPLANTGELPVTPVAEVLSAVAGDAGTDPLNVVIDGTMLSGAWDPFSAIPCDSPITVLYYESASKYLQLGLDLTLAGLVAVPIQLRSAFDRLRRNTGTILYEEAALRLPRYDRPAFVDRMRRMTRNAILIGDHIEEFAGDVVAAVFPGLPSHPGYALGSRFAHLGGVMTFEFLDAGLNSQDALNAFIERAIRHAERKDVPLTRGVSFGFSAPRLSAASAMAEGLPPFLRLSVGDQSNAATLLLAHVLATSFVDFVADVGRLRTPNGRARVYRRRSAGNIVEASKEWE